MKCSIQSAERVRGRAATAASVLVLALAALAPAAGAQCEVQQLTAGDASEGDLFGTACAVDGDTMLIGAPEASAFKGAVYVFERSGSGWTQMQRLEGDPSDLSRFGTSVAIEGDTLLVGATFESTQNGHFNVTCGAVRVFERQGSQWVETQKLLPSDLPNLTTGDLDHFGFSVAISGDRAVVGAPWHNGTSCASGSCYYGAVYLFEKQGSTWVETRKFENLQFPEFRDEYGTSVDIEGDFIAVGSPMDNYFWTGQGTVHVYEWQGNSWLVRILSPSGIGANDKFGQSVSISGDRILAGAVGVGGYPPTGAAFVFRRVALGDWVETAMITASDAEPDDEFGSAVSLEGVRALIGAPGDNPACPYTQNCNSGAAYLYELQGASGWVETAHLAPSGGDFGDHAGTSVALSGGTAVLGAPDDDDHGSSSGSAWVFSMGEPEVYCTAKVNSKGCTPAIGHSGVPSASDPRPFDITAVQVISNKNGIFFYGVSGRMAVPFQGGLLCVQPPIRRTPVQSSGGNPPPNDCSGAFTFDFNAWLQGGGDPGLAPGGKVNGQYWYRDPQSPSTTGLTDAIEFAICW